MTTCCASNGILHTIRMIMRSSVVKRQPSRSKHAVELSENTSCSSISSSFAFDLGAATYNNLCSYRCMIYCYIIRVSVRELNFFNNIPTDSGIYNSRTPRRCRCTGFFRRPTQTQSRKMSAYRRRFPRLNVNFIIRLLQNSDFNQC